MIVALWSAIVLLAIVFTIGFGALIEMYEQVKHMRKVLGLEDVTLPVELSVPVGTAPGEVGLPAVLDQVPHAFVLFVSDNCATCHVIAAGLRDRGLAPELWVVVVPTSGRAEQFVAEFALRDERVLIDQDQRMVGALGITLTPVGVTVIDGRIGGAHTVPSVRQLDDAVKEVGRATQKAKTH
jgi:hypothetical protein